MSPISVDLTNVEAWKGGQTLPKGRHLCRCTEAEDGKSSGGHFELQLVWEAIQGEAEGGRIQDWVQVTDATLGKVVQLMQATGLTIPQGQFSLTAEPFKGRTAYIIVREGTKPDGSPKVEVAAYDPPETMRGSDVPGARQGEFQHQQASQADRDAAPF